MIRFLLLLGIIASLFLLFAVSRLWVLKKKVTPRQFKAVALPILAAVILLLPTSALELTIPNVVLKFLYNGGAQIWLTVSAICLCVIGASITFMTKDMLRGIHMIERDFRGTTEKPQSAATVLGLQVIGILTMLGAIGIVVAVVLLY